ncbi:hypothetical protein COCON_G00048550 [Conger conger]|uniref:Peroxisomal bifunctional enzyme n=1 Tax=Conger conger TaxID=82655 RepID=A0A9Q1DV12_CONCO|nr:hypothetical protein COCON_G00048550 [Conger conger]
MTSHHLKLNLAKNLGVTLDDNLSLAADISSTARICRFFLHNNIRYIHHLLMKKATQVLVQALVISHLDYCNSCLAGLLACAIKPLQLVQNAAARLTTGQPSAAVRQGITDTVSRAVSDPEVKGVVLCGENGKFCGGADIKEFGGQMKGPHLVPMIDAIEATAKPVVAAIEGMALGGGLELALACHYRIAHVKGSWCACVLCNILESSFPRVALLGLPEVALGLLPGAGGTQRLPRLIGVPAALDLITTGRHVSAQEALKLGIVDRITAGNTLEVAAEFVRSVSGTAELNAGWGGAGGQKPLLVLGAFWAASRGPVSFDSEPFIISRAHTVGRHGGMRESGARRGSRLAGAGGGVAGGGMDICAVIQLDLQCVAPRRRPCRYETPIPHGRSRVYFECTGTLSVNSVTMGATPRTEQRLALPRLSTCPTPCPPDLDSFLERAMAQVRRRARGALAPVACVQAVRAAATLPYSQGMRVERELMATLFKSQQARAMQYCFFSQRSVGRWSTPSGARWDNSSPLPVQNAAVIGTARHDSTSFGSSNVYGLSLGTMGRGIVVSFARAGIPVVGVEMDAKQLVISRRAVTSMLERDARRQGAELPEGLVRFTTDLRDLREVDLVIEAVFEDMALKKRVFGELSSVCRPDTLLCSNTSTLDLDQLAAATHRPELVVGMHFFSPANVMKLLEVIYGLGKVSVAVGNCHGFVGNRMVLPYMSQANFLVEEGATPEQVDQVLEEFGFSMGVFRMSDLAGLDVGWRIRKESGLTGPGVAPGEPARSRKGSRYSPLADLLCEQGRLGQKTGCGWYLYDRPGGREAKPDPWMRGFLEEYRSSHGLRARPVDQQEVLERCLYALVNEGFRVLEDGIAAGPEDVDVIYVLGYSWPPHRGGPMFHAAAVGLPAVLDRLEHYHQAHPDVPGLQPSALLRKLVARGSPPIHKWREVIKNIRISKSDKLDEAQALAKSCAGRPDFLPCDGLSICATHSHGKCFKLHWCCHLGSQGTAKNGAECGVIKKRISTSPLRLWTWSPPRK